MQRYSEIFIRKIREIRKREKVSYYELEKRHGIPSSTIRNWCVGLVDNKWDVVLLKNMRLRDQLKESEISVIPSDSFFDNQHTKFIAALLYGCEGSKYPASNTVAFANSDPGLVKTFFTMLSRGFDLDATKFSVHLQIHSDQDYEGLKRYWSTLLGISLNRFIQPTITSPTGKKHRQHYKGTCTLRYRDYRIQLKLLGIFEAFIGRNYDKIAK